MPPLQIALTLLQFLPGLILDVERLFKGRAKAGPEKRQYVVDAVGRAVDLAQHFGVKELAQPGVKDQVVGAAGAFTDAIVGSFNASGAFDRTPQAA